MEIHQPARSTRSQRPGTADDDGHELAGELELAMELALLTAPATDVIIVWSASRQSASRIRAVEQLVVRVAALASGEFGVADVRGGDQRWAQTMCVGDAWIVEVHDGSPCDWATRVQRTGATVAPAVTADSVGDADRWTAMGAAEVMWSWLHGSLPVGTQRVPLRVTAAGTAADGTEWVTADL